MCSTVIAACDGTEALLSSGIPDLQLARFVLDLDDTHPKIDSNSRNVGVAEVTIGEFQQQGRFTHAAVSYNQNLKEIVVFTGVVLSLDLAHCGGVLIFDDC
jgi:hypothetical protein